MGHTPKLTNGDIMLRPTVEGDEAGIAAAGRDPLIREMPWFGFGFQDSWAGPWVRRAMDEWTAGRHHVFSILYPDGRYLGSVVAGALTEDAVEIAYWVLPDERRRGVATRAVQALLPWVRQTFPAARIWAKTSLANAASQGVLKKCGFLERARGDVVTYDWPDAGPPIANAGGTA